MRKTSYSLLATPGVEALTPYVPGKPLAELYREYGIDQAIKLASNENPLGVSPKVVSAMQAHSQEVARYPDGNGFILKQALSQHLATAIDTITLGNGSNDILELIARAFVTAEDEVIFSQYAFAVYPLVTQAIGAKSVVVAAKNWGNDLAAMQAAVNEKTKVIFIANPNNPTGTWNVATELEQFLAAVPKQVLIVLDEAYFEYAKNSLSGVSDYPDGMQYLTQYENLIITRTFSKAYALAGLRVGYAISSATIADYLNRVRQPFNVNSLALIAATTALSDTTHLDKSVALNWQEMRKMVHRLEQIGLSYIPSLGNFITIKVGKKSALYYEDLLRKGVIVRPLANYQMPEFLRFSLGLAEENQQALEALQEVMQ